MSESSLHFDADAAAVQPPTVTIAGQRYVGRVLSIVEWGGFLDRFLGASKDEFADVAAAGKIHVATMIQNHEFCLDYLRAAIVVSEGAPDPVALLEAQGERLLKEVFAHFFGHQCYVQGVALRTPTDAARDEAPKPPVPPRNGAGTSSSDSTPKAPSDDAPPG